jgi:hypothetical protein
MTSKPFKCLCYLILASVIGLVSYIVIGFAFFAYKEQTLVSGCEQEFCVKQTKAQVAALFEGKYSFDSGVMVPYDPNIKPSPYIYTDHANSIDEMIAEDRWSIVYDSEKGWRKFVHLKFRDDVLYQIDILNYGPFYIDP